MKKNEKKNKAKNQYNDQGFETEQPIRETLFPSNLEDIAVSDTRNSCTKRTWGLLRVSENCI